MTALLVEDQARFGEAVVSRLQARGVHVTAVATMPAAAEALHDGAFRVVIVDLDIDHEAGLELLVGLRRSGSDAHVIILGDSTSEADLDRAFACGANEYVVKPFFARELITRVLAVRRRPEPQLDSHVQVGPWLIDLGARRVESNGKPLALTAKEFDLFAYLAVRPDHVFSRDDLLKAVWKSAEAWQRASTVTEHIRRLRNKIEVDPSRPKLIRTVRRAGYRLDMPCGPADPAPQAHVRPLSVTPGMLIHVQGRIVFADPPAIAIAGFDDENDLVGRSLADMFAPGSQVAAAERIAATGAGQARRSEVMELRRPDGAEVAVEIASSTITWHGESARRIIVTPLPDEPSRLLRLVTGVGGDVTDAVIVTDMHLHIRGWNAAAGRLYGWTQDQALGRHVLDVMQWVSDQAAFAAAWESLEVSGRWGGEGLQRTRDGSIVEVATSMTLLREESGEPTGIVSVNRIALGSRQTATGGQADDEAAIRRGISNGEFDVFYQPIVDLDGSRVRAFEALLRWNHPERGLLVPNDFLPAAERSGLIRELGQIAFDKACTQGAHWRGGGADLNLAFNLSTGQLADPALVDRLIAALASSGFDPAALWLEVTETSVVQELETLTRGLDRLVALGVRVAIDHFGTGWASLTYLRDLPVHALKIDASFVAGVEHQPSDIAIVRSILSLGGELGLLVVAEGVETESQHRTLQGLGCTIGQGYFYGRPTPAADVPADPAPRFEPAGPVISVTHDPVSREGRAGDDRLRSDADASGTEGEARP